VLQLIDQARKLDPLEPRLDVAKATFLFYGRGEVGEAETLLIAALRKHPPVSARVPAVGATVLDGRALCRSH
jgi:hypothetical protein